MPGPRIFSGNEGSNQWLQGEADPQPADGIVSSYWLNTLSKEVFLKISPSVWTSQGKLSSGGGSGNLFRMGSGAPDAGTVGDVEDRYLDQERGTLYSCWAPGMWQLVGLVAKKYLNNSLLLGFETGTFGFGADSIGISLLSKITFGEESIAIGKNLGDYAMNVVVGNRNILIGEKSFASVGCSSTNQENTILGHYAGKQIAAGSYNIAIGNQAMGSDGFVSAANALNMFGSFNIAIGFNSLSKIKADSYGDIAIGRESGKNLGLSFGNLFIGDQSGMNFVGSSGNGYNTFLGSGAGLNISSGLMNVALGTQSFDGTMTSSSYNTCIGSRAGRSLGTNNCVAGYNAASTLDKNASSNNNIIGANALRNYSSLSSVFNSNIIESNATAATAQGRNLNQVNFIGPKIPDSTDIRNSNLIGASILGGTPGQTLYANIMGYQILMNPGAGALYNFNAIGANIAAFGSNVSAGNTTAMGNAIAEFATSLTSFTAFGNRLSNGTSCLTLSQSEVIGSNSGNLKGNMSNSTYIGTNCNHSPTSACVNNLCLGFGAQTNGDNQIVLGTTSHTTFRVPRFTAAGTLSTDASGNITSASDERMKTEIQPIANALDVLSQMRGVTYKWREETGLDTIMRYGGCIAQDWAKAFPDCVAMETNTGNYSLNYNLVVGTLVEAVKSLYNRVKALESA